MDKKLTIIMPIYNCESTVKRALDSIPIRPDIEVICIDDCSTDNSLEVVTKYTETSPLEITVLKTPVNGGPGAARNLGYDLAKGEFIFGLDSDDYILTENLNELLNTINLEPFDIVHTLIEVSNGRTWGLNCECAAVHTYLARRSFIGNTRMPTIRRGEDQRFLDALKAKKPAPRVGLLKSVLVHYNWGVREDSITYKFKHGIIDELGRNNE